LTQNRFLKATPEKKKKLKILLKGKKKKSIPFNASSSPEFSIENPPHIVGRAVRKENRPKRNWPP